MKVIKSVYKDSKNGVSSSHVIGRHLYGQKEQPVCINIEMTEPTLSGQRTYCDCYYDNNVKVRVYDPDVVFWEDEVKQ